MDRADWTFNVFLFHFLIHALAGTRKVTTAGKNEKKKFQKGRLLYSARSSLETNRPEAIRPHLLCTCLKDAACILRVRDGKAEQTQGRAAERGAGVS